MCLKSQTLGAIGEALFGWREEPTRPSFGPTINRDVVPRHVRREIRGKEEGNAGLILWPAKTADWGPRLPKVLVPN